MNLFCLGTTFEKVSARFSHHHTSFSHHQFLKVFTHELLPKMQVIKFPLITHHIKMRQPQSKGWNFF